MHRLNYVKQKRNSTLISLDQVRPEAKEKSSSAMFQQEIQRCLTCRKNNRSRTPTEMLTPPTPNTQFSTRHPQCVPLLLDNLNVYTWRLSVFPVLHVRFLPGDTDTIDAIRLQQMARATCKVPVAHIPLVYCCKVQPYINTRIKLLWSFFAILVSTHRPTFFITLRYKNAYNIFQGASMKTVLHLAARRRKHMARMPDWVP